MQPEVQPAGHELLELHLDVFVVGSKRRPSVDDEEDVAVAVVDLPLGAQAPVGGHRLDPPIGEELLPILDDRVDLSVDAIDPGFVGAQRDARDVGEVAHAGEGSAAEVHDVDLDLLGGVRQRERADDRPSEGRLARLRRADDRQVPARTVQVEHEGVAALVERAVDVPDRDDEGARPPPARRVEAQRGADPQIGHEGVQGGGLVERRQPHLVGGGPFALHPRHRDVEGRVGHSGDPRVRELAELLLGLRLGLLRLLDVLLLQAQGRGGEIVDLDLVGFVDDIGRREVLPARRGPGDIGCAEPDEVRRVGLEEADARDGGKLVGVVHAYNGAGFLGREGAQADAVRQVGVQASQTPLLQLLRREEQVDLERAAEAADRDEHVDEVRLLGQQLGELVGDHEERGDRFEILPSGFAGLLVVGDVLEVAGGLEDLLTPRHLASQGVLHAVDEGQVLPEIGDDGRDVRHLRHAGEGGSALEVDEHEVELFGGVGHRQGEDEGAQHLGLARTGGADDQAVRSHARQGGLLDVEVDGLVLGRQADRDAEPVPGQPRLPPLGDVEVADVAQPQEVDELGGGLARGVDGLARAVGLDAGLGRQAARDDLRLRDADPVSPPDHRGEADL